MKIAIYGFFITLTIMLLAENDLIKSVWKKEDVPETVMLLKEKQRLENEFARQEQIRLQTPVTRVITLQPGQTIRVPVGEKYEFDCHNGEFHFSLLYKGQRVKTGYFKPGFSMNTGNIPVDGIEFHQDPRYPYGELAIVLKSTPTE